MQIALPTTLITFISKDTHIVTFDSFIARNNAAQELYMASATNEKQLMAGGGVALIGLTLIPLLSGLLSA